MPAARHSDFQNLPADRQRVILLLAPILRIADALDRSRDQRIEQIQCELRPSGLYLSIFLMVTLLILFGASWIGSYFAKRITRPVQMLATAAPSLAEELVVIAVK